jgi:hypothetical protein
MEELRLPPVQRQALPQVVAAEEGAVVRLARHHVPLALAALAACLLGFCPVEVLVVLTLVVGSRLLGRG